MWQRNVILSLLMSGLFWQTRFLKVRMHNSKLVGVGKMARSVFWGEVSENEMRATDSDGLDMVIVNKTTKQLTVYSKVILSIFPFAQVFFLTTF